MGLFLSAFGSAVGLLIASYCVTRIWLAVRPRFRRRLSRAVHHIAIRRAIRGDAKWIHLNNRLYLERYVLRGGSEQDGSKVNVWLHKFHQPDDERGPHNHPHRWNFSLILLGGYREKRVARANASVDNMQYLVERTYTAGDFNFIRQSDFHRISELIPCPDTGEVWTLFVSGPKHGLSWGYLIDWVFRLKKNEGGCQACPWGSVECVTCGRDIQIPIDTTDFDDLTPVHRRREEAGVCACNHCATLDSWKAAE